MIGHWSHCQPCSFLTAKALRWQGLDRTNAAIAKDKTEKRKLFFSRKFRSRKTISSETFFGFCRPKEEFNFVARFFAAKKTKMASLLRQNFETGERSQNWFSPTLFCGAQSYKHFTIVIYDFIGFFGMPYNCCQSYKYFTIVNYNSGVVIWANL